MPVIGAKAEAMFLLNCPSGPMDLHEIFGANGPRDTPDGHRSAGPYRNSLH
jgi:hypothetical protein